ncbi:unnamed protein product [Rhizoctonia solani]|uniref:DUF6533 domain-containing protein n=2 Tax=Rhizoctonia solani TaxID=456999 RepID=A0A8H3HQX8_9AGAM|nr:putative transmembrane protein [Rhizoctonia solani 123E]CAE6361976.1 unnamed protein product [Rhizoctonia solani]CAE6531481.1 unnamed protein product [Rhizoctonia solani]
MSAPDITKLLPPSLLLPAHLSAHKYFFVCTLTVAAWDTLVLSPRTWRLMKTKEWPPLKILYHVLRYVMPIEFTIVAVAFFDTKWPADRCQNFYLFEPIITMCLVSLCSVVALIRLHAIFDHSKAVLGGLGILLTLQVGIMAACCAFYRPMPLKEGQGCIAGPTANWVGIYWLAPTVFWSAAFALALSRSIQSLRTKPLGPWKLMLRDGLNLYGAIWIVNMVNMLFWFIVRPKDNADTIKTIVTSMTAVLTVTMTLRIILSVRGSLQSGGAYSGTTSSGASRSHPSNSGAIPGSNSGPHIISTRATHPVVNIQTERHHTVSGGGHQHTRSGGGAGTGRQTWTLDEMRGRTERDDDNVSNVSGVDAKGPGIGEYGITEDKSHALASEEDITNARAQPVVRVMVDREVDERRE